MNHHHHHHYQVPNEFVYGEAELDRLVKTICQEGGWYHVTGFTATHVLLTPVSVTTSGYAVPASAFIDATKLEVV